VDQSTIRRWIEEDRIKSITLPGGRKRYRRSDIEAILAGDQTAQGAA
jgi:predicted site-specific integrase-resolvase